MFRMGGKLDAGKISQEVENGDAVLIDVRTKSEWQTGHAKDAVNIPVDHIASGVLPEAETGSKLYVYCASGGRSSMAARYLQQEGYLVENIGGLSDWRALGGEVEA